MEEAVTGSTTIPWWQVAIVVGGLVAAIVFMFKHLLRQQANHRADIKEFTAKVTTVVSENTSSNVALKSTIEAMPDKFTILIERAARRQ